MSDKTRIDNAKEIVGDGKDDDYIIRPTEFPAQFEESASDFASLLKDSALVVSAKNYERVDARAGEWQKRFKKHMKIATWSIFCATSFAALLAASASVQDTVSEPLLRAMQVACGATSIATSVVSALFLYIASRGRELQKWMQSRAEAETARLGYFKGVVQKVCDNYPDQPQLLLAALEFFRRYQLEIQQRFYEGRNKDHENDRGRTVLIGVSAAAILALGSALGGGLGTLVDPKFAPLAALGTIGAALALVASRREEINQSERNAERYRRTAGHLREIRKKHLEVQKAVAQGNTSVILDYVDAIQNQLSLEHRQWLSEGEEVDSAVKAMEESLAQHRAEQESKRVTATPE